MSNATGRMIPVGEVAQRLTLSVRDVWRKAAAELIPKPVKIGTKTTRWFESEIDEFIEKLKERKKP